MLSVVLISASAILYVSREFKLLHGGVLIKESAEIVVSSAERYIVYLVFVLPSMTIFIVEVICL